MSDDYDDFDDEHDGVEPVFNDNSDIAELDDEGALTDLHALDGTSVEDGDFTPDAALPDNDDFAEPGHQTAQGSLFAASTGDPRVDGAVARLGDLATSDITEHPAVLEDVHRRLHEALADLDR